MYKNNKKWNITFTKVFTPFTQYFVEAPFGSDYSLKSWVWCYKLGTSVFGEFLLLFATDPLKLCQVGWGASLYNYFQHRSQYNRTELERICREEWEKLPKYRCAKLLASYPRRLEAVISAKRCFNKVLSKGSEYLCKNVIFPFFIICNNVKNCFCFVTMGYCVQIDEETKTFQS